MSSGGFVNANYQSDVGTTHRVKVQPETLELSIDGVANDPTLNQVDSPFSARVSGSRRGYGLYARTVTVRFLEGDAPVGYEDEGIITLPWLDPGTFAGILPGKSGQYLESTVEVVGKRAEVAR